MNPHALPASRVPALRAVDLDPDDAPLLQRFFDANADYFHLVEGRPAMPDAARETLVDLPPAGMPYAGCRRIGYATADGALGAYAQVVVDLFAPGVCHLGLFIVDSARHGTGEAHALVDGLEAWAREGGAAWMRLGVVVGNTRGERFWTRCGYVETRLREGNAMGLRVHTVRAMFKPLAGGTRADFLALVARDRPESP